MPNSCKSCFYWDLEKQRPHGRGQCMKALLYEEGDTTTKDEPMLTLDGSQYMAILMTLPTHCCKEWADVARC